VQCLPQAVISLILTAEFRTPSNRIPLSFVVDKAASPGTGSSFRLAVSLSVAIFQIALNCQVDQQAAAPRGANGPQC
jgi:hypothetical protein